MASTAWTGGADDGNWSTAGNWNPNVPINTNDVTIGVGYVGITAGLNQSAVTAATLTITDNYKGDRIGSDSAALQFNTSGICQVASRTMRYCKLSGSFVTLKCLGMYSGGSLLLSGSGMTTLELGMGGYCEVADDTNVATLRMAGSMGCMIGADSTANDLTADISRASTLRIKRRLTIATIGGRVSIEDAGAISGSSPVVKVEAGGVLNLASTGTFSGTIELKPGSTLSYDGARANIDLSSMTIRRYPDSKIIPATGITVAYPTITYVGWTGNP